MNSSVEKERDILSNNLEQAKRDLQAASDLAAAKLANELQNVATIKDAQIQELTVKLNASDMTQKIALNQALSMVEKERDELKNNVGHLELEKNLPRKRFKINTRRK